MVSLLPRHDGSRADPGFAEGRGGRPRGIVQLTRGEAAAVLIVHQRPVR